MAYPLMDEASKIVPPVPSESVKPAEMTIVPPPSYAPVPAGINYMVSKKK